MGEGEGDGIGDGEGEGDGVGEGDSVGTCVGTAVGIAVGAWLGTPADACVGIEVGTFLAACGDKDINGADGVGVVLPIPLPLKRPGINRNDRRTIRIKRIVPTRETMGHLEVWWRAGTGSEPCFDTGVIWPDSNKSGSAFFKLEGVNT